MDPDHFSQNTPFFEESLLKKGVPKLTRWRSLRGLLSLFWIAEGDPRIHFFHTSLKAYPLYLELIILPATYALFWKYYFPALPSNSPTENHCFFCLKSFQLFFMGYIFTTCMFTLVFSHLKDPGYLPFYFPYYYNTENEKERRTSFTQDEMRWGLAIDEEQIKWARAQPRPDRVCFSEAVGYYVIRGDHICTYINNWVGLYNHRWFVILLVHLVLYIADYLFVFIYTQYVIHTQIASKSLSIVQLCIGIPFLALIANNLLNQMLCISHNILLKDAFKGEFHDFDLGSKIANFEVIFGHRKYILLWFLPVPLPRFTDGFDFHENISQKEIPSETRNNDAVDGRFNPLQFTRFTRNRTEIVV